MGRASGDKFIIEGLPRRPEPPYPENPPQVYPGVGERVKEPKRVLLAGDVHGDMQHLMMLIRVAKEKDCQAIFQVGDFGFWLHRTDDTRTLLKVSKALEKEKIDLFFTEGNHDSYDHLWGFEHPLTDGWPTIGKRIYFVPRGTRWVWGGKKFLAVGGAVSMDKDIRLRREAKSGKPHTMWWPQEALTDEQVEDILPGGEADIVLSHDVPLGSSIDGSSAIGSKTDPETADNRRRLRRIVDHVAPELLVHGHYHHRYSGIYPSYTLGRAVKVEGLGMNGSGERSYAVLDISALSIS
jgi:Icc-related predicted phosphoesterase